MDLMAQMQPFISSARERLLRVSVCEYCLPLLHANSSQPLHSQSWKRPAYPRSRRSHQVDTRRHKTTTATTTNHDPAQAYPLKGYYSDILTTQYPSNNPPTQPETGANKPTPEPVSEEQSPAEKLSIVFGTRLAGPGYSSRYNPSTSPESTWRTINGVPIPPRPDEPDNCCMSGCVHCVWDDYRDEVENWADRVREAKMRGPQEGDKKKGGAQRDMRQKQRREVESASLSMDDDGGGSESNWSEDPLAGDDDLFSGIPVGIREFMKTEKKLKEKKRLN